MSNWAMIIKKHFSAPKNATTDLWNGRFGRKTWETESNLSPHFTEIQLRINFVRNE